MEVTRDRVSLWEALAGRAPGRPTGPADADLWDAVVERLNPAKVRPVLRQGIEEAHLTSVRGQRYVMLRSPDREAAYVRLSPEERELAHLMDGTRTVAQLVREFVRISGRLAPEQVTRTVADLAANRMLAELPVDAFRPLERVRRHHGSRLGRGLLEAAKGRRIVLADFDRPADLLYRAIGRWLFTRAGALVVGLLALTGLVLFVATWIGGAERLLVAGGSYAAGGALLLGLNILALVTHELGHALAVKHAGRRVPAIGFLFYFGIPSAFVDTTDVWMKGRRARLLTSAAGPLSALTMAGLLQLVALVWPELAPIVFRLAFMWYLNALFNLNPLMALDGYYLAMDWLEIPNLRARGIGSLVRTVRTRSLGWAALDREGRFVTMYGFLAALWLVVFLGIAVRMWRDRVAGLVAGAWHAGWVSRGLVIVIVVGLFAPVVHGVLRWMGRRIRAARRRRHEQALAADAPNRRRALEASRLGSLPPDALEHLAAESRWLAPRRGEVVRHLDADDRDVLVVVEGALEGRRPGDTPGTVRARALPGQLIGIRAALAFTAPPLVWLAAGTRLLRIPAAAFARVVGPLLGPLPPDWVEAEGLIADAPAFVGLEEEAREALLRCIRPAAWSAGEAITLDDPDRGVVVANGTLRADDGEVFGRGDLLVPVGPHRPLRAVARTSVSAWEVPELDKLSLFGADASPPAADGRAPSHGAHGEDVHVPVAAPPTPQPPPGDDEADRRLQRRLARILALALLLALLAIPLALAPGTGWAELPSDRALLQVRHGDVQMSGDDGAASLTAGARRSVGPGDRVAVGDRALAELTYAGGATQVLCAGTLVDLGSIERRHVPAERWFQPLRTLPQASMTLHRGRILADSRADRAAFLPLDLTVSISGRDVTTVGEAGFVLDPGRLVVEHGDVTLDGVPVPAEGPGSGGGCPGSADLAGVVLLAEPAEHETGEGSGDLIAREGHERAGDLVGEPRRWQRGAIDDPMSQPELIPEPGPGQGEEPEPHAVPDPTPDLDPSPDPGSDAEPDPGPDPDLDPDPDPEPDPDPDPDPEPDPDPAPGFSLTCSPSSLTVTVGGTAHTTCTVSPDDGFTGTVTLSCADLPEGLGCAWANGTGAVDIGDDPVHLRLAVSAGREAVPGETAFGIVAIGQGIAQEFPLQITVSR